MIIYLMGSPWAAKAAHRIEADSLATWRQAVASIPPGQRYCAAVVIGDDARPRPVQWFNGADWSRDVLSADGFLVVRTGLPNAPLAERQWAILADFPSVLGQAQQYFDEIGGFARQAFYPPPKLVE